MTTKINPLQRQTAGETVFPAESSETLLKWVALSSRAVAEHIDAALSGRHSEEINELTRRHAVSFAKNAAHYAFLAYPELRPGYVPFSEYDACWCQPFDGPTHPNCPMHGSTEEDRRASARKDFDALYPTQQQSALRQDLGTVVLNRAGFPSEVPLESCGICTAAAPDGTGICDACHLTLQPAKPSAALPWLHYEEFRGLQMVIARRKYAEKVGR